MNKEHCNGKVMFSKTNAESFVKGKKMSRITKKKMRIYLCEECYFYHLTTDISSLKNLTY